MKKALSFIMVFVMIFVMSPFFACAASPQITGLKIITQPQKLVFYKNADWTYGIWETDEAQPGKCNLISSSKISFTHNPGGGRFGDRGMVDMTGLVIRVSYSNGTTKDIQYKETLNKSGYYTANILVAPAGGKEFFIGKNQMEVYLAENTKYYDTYTIEISNKEQGPSQDNPGENPEEPEKKQFFLIRWFEAVANFFRSVAAFFGSLF